MSWLSVLPGIVSIGDKVIDRMIPDPEAAAKAKAEFAREAALLDQGEVREFHDFVVDYEGKAADVHPALQMLRGSVRPVLTYALAGAYIWGFLHPNTFTPEVMTGLFQLNLISLGFWYGEKALKRLGMDLSRKGKQ